jgi:hypothetical protein
MSSRKQRRRRAKERRHDYEYVYLDEEGNETEPPEGTAEPSRDSDGKERRNGAKGGRAKSGGPIREVKPPAWGRSIKRAALFLPLFFIVFSLVNKSMPVETRVLSSVAYSALFVPLTYMMDRMAYRTYLRRSGRRPEKG